MQHLQHTERQHDLEELRSNELVKLNLRVGRERKQLPRGRKFQDVKIYLDNVFSNS